MNLVPLPDKFGFYRVGPNKLYSKREALEISNRNHQNIEYIFNDDVFSLLDWSIEPSLSLPELYQKRAQQIRETYDYIVIFYSGAADSHNMLEAFLHAGVEIDEIVSFHSLSGDGDPNSAFNREVFETAVPFVNKLKESGRLDKSVPHRLIDLTELINTFIQQTNLLDLSYYANSSPSVNNTARSWLRRYVTDWSRIIDSNKNLVLVWGHDKPRTMHEFGKFYLNFMDITDNCVSPWVQQHCPAGWFDELFYNTPDLPELTIKQAHVVCNFLRLCPESHPWLTDTVTGLGHVVKHRDDGSWKAKWLTQDALSLLIYPWFDPKLYYEKKPADIIYSTRDKWFWKNTDLGNRYKAVINGMISTFGRDWLQEDPVRGTRSTRNFRSRRYWIDK